MKVSWQQTLSQIEGCKLCGLHETRLQVVPGEGDIHASLMLIGEGPGAQEDQQGRPFVGAAGQLLDKMLGAINLTRGEVYIANVVKCRPPGNRTPTEDEAAACLPYLRAQTALIRPKIIVLLGATAARNILGSEIRITRDRGVWRKRGGIYMMPTFHPAALLREPAKKREAWEDFQQIRDKLKELSNENINEGAAEIAPPEE